LDFHLAGSHFLLDTATLNILSYCGDIPAISGAQSEVLMDGSHTVKMGFAGDE
jgi:hypothetical protein